ncbi:hypothetical protein MOX02_22960 [Methylobacterium oxalidis]|uniref:CobW/HypB/UreG nucleotide-binding domain-containing protein n=1 Tax=Methylobacterium oxalidis TaxID=944322 RepID=A0A512J2R0_9HYPH|nr:hypothetical protein MOX02_22960 [Methylobacterium oxalidis]GJE35076.1 Urease accessory protein UreG [Methylobacterium oxalidis]GLS67223.1 hypothetical protein GCM10007888_56060 [Methylobacterium oxalidis]
MPIESGGDDLAATFSPELADLTLSVIDVAGGEKIPRRGGPGITRSDLLVVNETDLAPRVGADLSAMEADTRRMRGARPSVFASLCEGHGADAVARFVVEAGGLG